MHIAGEQEGKVKPKYEAYKVYPAQDIPRISYSEDGQQSQPQQLSQPTEPDEETDNLKSEKDQMYSSFSQDLLIDAQGVKYQQMPSNKHK